MPVTITRPRAPRIVSTAATKGAPKPSDIAATSAATPSDSVSSVRSADAMWECVSGFGAVASDELILARVLTHKLHLILPDVGRDGSAYLPQAANASAKARSPGGPFSKARIARPPLL